MTDVWLTEDLPFLQATRKAEDEAPPGASVSVAKNLDHFGLEKDKALKVAMRLGRAEYLDVKPLDSTAGTLDVYIQGLTERGRRAVGQWPTDDPWANLVELLSSQIEEEPDQEKKGRMIKLRDGILAAGRDISTSLLKAYLEQQMGM